MTDKEWNMMSETEAIFMNKLQYCLLIQQDPSLVILDYIVYFQYL